MEKKEQFFKTMNDYHKRLKEYVKSGDLEKEQNPDEWLWKKIEQELDRAREEVIKNLIKKIEEANCDSISLELLREIDLSKLTTK